MAVSWWKRFSAHHSPVTWHCLIRITICGTKALGMTSFQEGLKSHLFIIIFNVYLFDGPRSQLWHAGSSVFTVACVVFSYSMWTLCCSMWDLVPWPGIEPRPLALGVQNLSHWTTRKAPEILKFCSTSKGTSILVLSRSVRNQSSLIII